MCVYLGVTSLGVSDSKLQDAWHSCNTFRLSGGSYHGCLVCCPVCCPVVGVMDATGIKSPRTQLLLSDMLPAVPLVLVVCVQLLCFLLYVAFFAFSFMC